MHSIEKMGLYIERVKRNDSSNDSTHTSMSRDNPMRTDDIQTHNDHAVSVNNNTAHTHNDHTVQAHNQIQPVRFNSQALSPQKSRDNENLNWSELHAYDGGMVLPGYERRGLVGYEDNNVLLKYFVVIWQRKWLIFFIALLVFLSALLFIVNLKPIYRASGTLALSIENLDLGPIKEAVSESTNSIVYLKTHEKKLKSREFADRVMNKVLAAGYDLNVLSAATLNDIADKGRSLIIVALVNPDLLHIRIFDDTGEKAVDKSEDQLASESGEMLTALKQDVDVFLNDSGFSQKGDSEISAKEKQLLHKEKLDFEQKIIERTVLIAGQPLLDKLAYELDFKNEELENQKMTNPVENEHWYSGLQQQVQLKTMQISEWATQKLSDMRGNQDDTEIEEVTKKNLIDSFLERLGVLLQKDSYIFEINFEATDPEFAAKMVNTTMNEYIVFDNSKQTKSQFEAHSSIAEQLKAAKANLENAENQLQKFREREKFIAIEENGNSLAMRKLAVLNDNYLAAVKAVEEAERTYTEAQNFSSQNLSPSSSSLPEAFRDDEILNDLISQQLTSLEKLNEIKALYTDLHPNILSHKITIDSQNAVIDGRIQTITSQLKKDLDSALVRREVAKNALDASEQEVLSIKGKERELNSLESEVDAHRNRVNELTKSLGDSTTATQVRPQNVSILDDAVAPNEPFKPERRKLLLIAAFIAMGLGLFAAFVCEFFNQTIKSIEDIESRLQIGVLGFIPKIKRNFFGFKTADPIHMFRDKPDSSFSEAFRSIRTNLLLTRVDTARKIILVTSPSENEGKSSVAMNLTRSLAENSNAILIDADMRKPTIGREMGLEDKASGLSHFLADLNKLEECIYRESDSRFSFIPSGRIPPNPLDLISSHRFKSLLHYLIENYDYVVIDTPPLTVSEALLLSTSVSGLILVLRSNKTKYKDAQNVIKQLRNANAPLMGAILNDVNLKYVSYKAYRYGTA